MPGIAGIISRQPAAHCERRVAMMLECMMHDRFYVSGTCFAPEMGAYAGWVGHQGSFAARQSAASAHTDPGLVFSGECFGNVDAGARSDVDAGGTGGSPTFVTTRYRALGDACFPQLNGLFSGLVVDRRQNRAVLFNDRYGVERMYVHETDDATYFASEAKALLHILPELRTFDDEGVSQFMAFGCTVRDRTLFRGVRLLEGGSCWLFQNGECRKQRYFRPAEWECLPPLTVDDFEAQFEATFERILPRYVWPGSGVGISLTGGLDTRMIMASLPPGGGKPVCYTFSGLKDRTLDERLAARIATACGLEHHVLRIGPDFLSDYGHYVDRAVYVTDGTCGALGAHEIYLNALARQLAPVRVTGNFGSEVLRGVSTLKPIGLSPDLFVRDFGPLVGSTALGAPGGAAHPVTLSAFCAIPWSLFGLLAAGRSQVTLRTPYLDNAIVALAYQTPVQSRRSPDSALHLVRNLSPALSRIPTDRGLLEGDSGLTRGLRRLVSEVTFKLDYLHKEGLPHWLAPIDSAIGSLANLGLLGLHKYLPFRPWFRRELATYVTDVLADAQTSRLPYWNRGFLGSIASDHISGRKNYVREINAVLTLEAVDRVMLRGSSSPGRSPAAEPTMHSAVV